MGWKVNITCERCGSISQLSPGTDDAITKKNLSYLIYGPLLCCLAIMLRDFQMNKKYFPTQFMEEAVHVHPLLPKKSSNELRRTSRSSSSKHGFIQGYSVPYSVQWLYTESNR